MSRGSGIAVSLVEVTDAAQIWHCCGYGAGQQLQLQFDPYPGNFHNAMDMTLKKQKQGIRIVVQ